MKNLEISGNDLQAYTFIKSLKKSSFFCDFFLGYKIFKKILKKTSTKFLFLQI